MCGCEPMRPANCCQLSRMPYGTWLAWELDAPHQAQGAQRAHTHMQPTRDGGDGSSHLRAPQRGARFRCLCHAEHAIQAPCRGQSQCLKP